MTRCSSARVRPDRSTSRYRALKSIVAAAGLLLAACAPLPTRSISVSHVDAQAAGRQFLAPPSSTGFSPAYATPERRRETLDQVWRTIEDVYYDPAFDGIDLAALRARSIAELAGVHSDADFYRLLQRNVGAMRDSHTNVLTPAESEDERTQSATRIGLGYDILDGRLVVDDVLAGSPADEAGIRRGMIIEAIDAQPIDAAFLEKAARASADSRDDASSDDDGAQLAGVRDRQFDAVHRLLEPAPDAPSHRIALLRPDDSHLIVTVVARVQDLPTVERYSLRPSGVGVLRLSRFDPSVLPGLETDIATARNDSRALIIDLRDDPGGETEMMRQLLEQFIERPVSLGTLRIRLWRWTLALDIDGTPVAHPYIKPLAVLIDGATGSSAEWAAHALVELRDAIAVGEPTCGCVVGIRREFLLPDGGVLRVAEAGARSPHGRRMENDPLVPSVAVEPTLAGLRSGDDRVVSAAERALLAR